jgi:glycerol uptake facilitator-like aquaporin
MRKFLAEFIGTAVLLTAIVGSGIMAQNLTDDVGIQILINAFSIALALYVLISLLSPISGAHLNPLITVYSRIDRNISSREMILYLLAQLTGGAIGTIVANLMFSKSGIDISSKTRSGLGIFIGEVLATLGLLIIVTLKSEKAATLVPTWIGSALLFSSSTSFANPAVTFSRTLTDTFTGIAPASLAQFLLAQIVALGIVLGVRAALKGVK